MKSHNRYLQLGVRNGLIIRRLRFQFSPHPNFSFRLFTFFADFTLVFAQASFLVKPAQLFLIAFFFVIQVLIVFPFCLLLLWGSVFPFTVWEGLFLSLLRLRPISAEVKQLCNELSLIVFVSLTCTEKLHANETREQY